MKVWARCLCSPLMNLQSANDNVVNVEQYTRLKIRMSMPFDYDGPDNQNSAFYWVVLDSDGVDVNDVVSADSWARVAVRATVALNDGVLRRRLSLVPENDRHGTVPASIKTFHRLVVSAPGLHKKFD